MIAQNTEKANTNLDINNSFISAIKALHIAKLLRQCNIQKTSRNLKDNNDGEKRTAFEIFQFLLMMVFEGCNLYRFLGSKKQDIACSKSTYNRFLNDVHYNWTKLLILLSARVITAFNSLTNPSRFKAFVLDDSVIPRGRSKKVELLAFIHDHVTGHTVKGFNLLCLGWTDGFSFLPVSFNMLSSAYSAKRIIDADRNIDKRTNGQKIRNAAQMHKTDAAISLLESALSVGINAGYILMDSWFTNEPFINRILNLGVDVIGMLKDCKQQYSYNGKLYNLKQLAAYHVRYDVSNDIMGYVTVRTKKLGIPVKLVFVRNRNKKSEYIVILSTDCSLSASEIIRRYGARWSIECCFKVCKSMLKLGKEFQPVNYDSTVSTTTIVLVRFIILEWIRRRSSDPRTMGEIFFYISEEVKDIELSEALSWLLSIIASGLEDGHIQIDETIRSQLMVWYTTQPAFIRRLCQESMGSILSAAA